MSLSQKIRGTAYLEKLISPDADVENLKVSGDFEGEKKDVGASMSATADVVNRYFYIANESEKVEKIKEIHGTAETTSTGTFLQVERLQGTESFGNGDNLLTDNSDSGFDLKGTADTLQEGTVASSTAVYLDEGDRLAINIDGATNEIASVMVEVEISETV